MKKYTKEQLTKAMVKYYTNAKNNPEEFDPNLPDDCQVAGERCIDYLLSLVEPEENKVKITKP
jgi:hypothetical protein